MNDYPDNVQATQEGQSGKGRLPIRLLLPADSPRFVAENAEHVFALAEAQNELPAILVHRKTMRVIDGMHRLRAAALNGQDSIDLTYFDGSEEEAFLAAVQANVVHGMPLTRAERQAATVRILAADPDRSDRFVASIVGLSPKTVAQIRRGQDPDDAAGTTRVGRDGRARPLNAAQGRRNARDLLATRPESPLRQIARAAGISLSTAHDVRERMRRGEDPVPSKHRARQQTRPSAKESHALQSTAAVDKSADQAAPRGRTEMLKNLRMDPALRLTETGRALLRWLHARAGGTDGWETFEPTVPPHCAYIVADLARCCAREWSVLASRLDQMVRSAG